MVISLEDELVPMVRLFPVFQEVSQPHLLGHLQVQERLLQVGGPVLLAEVQEDVRRRQEHAILDRDNRREYSPVPEFPELSLISSRYMALELLVRDQLLEQTATSFQPDLLVD